MELARRLPWFPGENARCRCFAHVLNLVVKSILRQFEGDKGSRETHHADEDPGVEGYGTLELEEMEEDSEPEEEVIVDVDELDVNIRPVGKMLSKVSHFFAYLCLFSSHTPVLPLLAYDRHIDSPPTPTPRSGIPRLCMTDTLTLLCVQPAR
jgi:hypothetical protein